MRQLIHPLQQPCHPATQERLQCIQTGAISWGPGLCALSCLGLDSDRLSAARSLGLACLCSTGVELA